MADYKAPLNNMQFLLADVFKLPNLWSSMSSLADVDVDTAKAILEEVARLAQEELAPLNREADEEGSHWRDGDVVAPRGFKDAYKLFCDGGWGSLSGNPEFDGMGMPKTLVAMADECVQGACMSFGLAPMLTAGAALALDTHASTELKSSFLPKMYSGQWSGAMDLTEPHCGTDLGLIRTRAEPLAGGAYTITGTKIFITWGEHDMAENIVHLVLAKLPDAPSGSRGISLFVVPKFLPDEQGECGERNAVSCGSIEKKMGIKGSATCVMNFDGAKGWLVGEPHQGLACMFTMMNYERLGVGVQAIGAAEMSYQNAILYARERIQGRSADGAKQPQEAADPLLVHADVRRMLLSMRATTEAGRAFYLYVAQWLDIAKFSDDLQRRSHAEKMVSLLTPVAKAFLTDRALIAAIDGQQIFGGHGYIREWGQEQLVRDIRITQIYEGTNGIQALDLIGRKTLANNGELLGIFIADITAFTASLEPSVLPEMVSQLNTGIAKLEHSTQKFLQQAATDKNAVGAAAVDYLAMLGLVGYGYMWLRMAVAATQTSDYGDAFVAAKLATAKFFFARIFPELDLLAARVESGSTTLMAMDDDWF